MIQRCPKMIVCASILGRNKLIQNRNEMISPPTETELIEELSTRANRLPILRSSQKRNLWNTTLRILSVVEIVLYDVDKNDLRNSTFKEPSRREIGYD